MKCFDACVMFLDGTSVGWETRSGVMLGDGRCGVLGYYWKVRA